MVRRTPIWAVLATLFSVIAVIGVSLPDMMAQASARSDSAPPAIRAVAGDGWRSGGPFGGIAQALALSPDFASDGLAFAGGWRDGPNGMTGGYGIVKTTDRGATWTPVFTDAPWMQLAVLDLALSPGFATDGMAFAATDGGLLRTRDRGATWERLAGGLPAAGNDPAADDVARVYLAPNFAAEGALLALMANGGLFISRDRGDTWASAPIAAIVAAAFSPGYATNGRLFVVVSGGGTVGLMLARSTDRGASWQVLQSLEGDRATDLLETGEGAVLVATESGVTRLTPAAAARAAAPNIGAPVRRLAVAGDHIYAAAENGLFITLSDGRAWQRYADTPAIAFRAVAACPQWGRCHALMASTYLGVLGTPDDNLEPWRWLGGLRAVSAKAVAASLAYATDGTLFAGAEDGLFRSTDRGLTWRLLTPGERPDHDSLFSQVRLSAAYATDGAVFAAYGDRVSGRRGLYLSTDRGESWTTLFAPFALDYPIALAVSPAYQTDRTIFVVQEDTLHKTTDGGATWRQIPIAPVGTYFTPMRLEVSPAYATDHTLFVSGWGGVRRSTDGGETWSATVASAPSYGLAVSPGYATDRTLWHTFRAIEGAGDGSPDSAVRRSTDGGVSWSWATAGLPGVYEPFPVPLAASPAYATDHTLFTALRGPLTAGAQRSLYRSLDGATAWQELGPAPGNLDSTDLAVSAEAFGRLTAHLATEAGVWHYSARCEERVVNGGFEADFGWEMPSTAYPASYDASQRHAGARSLRTGIVSGPDVYSYSTGRQVVTIPAGVESAVLNFWWYPVSAEPPAAVAANSIPSPDSARALAQGVRPQGVQAGDWQYVLVYAADGTLLPPRLWTRSNAQAWQTGQLDLTPYRGSTITLIIGTFNDGDGRSSAMFVDDVALTTCWPDAPWPTVTRTPSPTATQSATPGPSPTRLPMLPRMFIPLARAGSGEPPPPPSATATPTGAPTETATPSATPTATPSATGTPASTPTPTMTPGATNTPPASPSATATFSLTPTRTPSRTPTASATPPRLTATAPASVTMTPTSTVTPTPGRACYETVVNGGFESDAGWTIRVNPVLAEYVTTPVHSGSRSLRTGIAAGGANVLSYSPIEQDFTFGAAATIQMRFWRYNVLEEGGSATTALAGPDLRALPKTEAELLSAPLAGDFFYVIAIRDDNSLDWLFFEQIHNPAWRGSTPAIDLSRYVWQHIRLQLGTYNDGAGGISRTFVDEVSIQICAPATPTATATLLATSTPSQTPTPSRTPSATAAWTRTPTTTATASSTLTATPTATRTPTRTLTPTATTSPAPGQACYEAAVNGGFESDAGWTIRMNPVLAEYATAPVHSGARSMRTGIAAGGANVTSYSPIQQDLTFPALPAPGVSSTIQLSFWRYSIYEEGRAALASRTRVDPLTLPKTEAELLSAPMAGDFFYVIAILDDGALDWLFTEQIHDPTWRRATPAIDLSRYAGQHIRLQFGTFNDGAGGISRTFVDDVSIQVCPPAGAFVLPAGWPRRVIGRPESNTIYADVNGQLFRSNDAGRNWAPAGVARPEHTILSADANVLYAGDGYPCYMGGDPTAMWRTLDGGATWQVLPAGQNLKPLAAHGADLRLYAAGCDGPYLSTDAGGSFVRQGDPLFGIYDAKSIALVAPGWNEVWVGGVSEGGGGGVLVSRDGGASWSLSYPRPGDGEIGWLGQATLDRYQSGRVYAPAYYGFFYTPDAGAGWINNSQGLADVIGGAQPSGLYAVAQDPGAPAHRLYLGTQRGLYARDNATAFWYKLAGQAFDALAVTDLLVLDGLPARLYATTQQGVFLYDLRQTPPATPTPTNSPTPTNTPGGSMATPTPTATPTASPTPTATTTAVPTAAPGPWPTPWMIASLSLPAGSHPHGVALDATGAVAYVAFHGAEHTGRTLGVVNTNPLALSAQITLSADATGPNGVALIGASGLVAAANRETANVAVVNPTTRAVVGQIPAGLQPDGVIVQGGFGYIANFSDNTVTVFDAATRAVLGTLSVGSQPSLFAADPAGNDVYLSLHGANEVLRLRDGAAVSVYTGVAAPYGLAFDPTSRRLYVANRGSAHTVTVIDTAAGTTLGVIGLDREPFVLAVNPRTGHLYVSCGDQVQVYRTLDWAPVTTITVPAGAEEGIALDALENVVYVTSAAGDALAAIQDVAPPLVLFGSNRDGNGELYRMLPDGREQIRLTFTSDIGEVSPAGSPDGKWIAYVRAGADGRQHLWLMNRDGHNARQLTFGSWDDVRPAWSGTGAQLAFASNRHGDWEILALRLADDSIMRLTSDPAEDTNPDWSWATGRIAFQSNRVGPNPEIFSMAADGSDVRRLTTNINGDRGPVWSPDGGAVVFWGSRAEQTLYKMRADGADITQLISRAYRPESPAWGPGSAASWIVFTGYRPDSGHSEIFRMTPAGTEIVLLTQNEVNFDYSPGWLPGQLRFRPTGL